MNTNIEQMIREAADKAGIPFTLFRNLIGSESSFDPTAENPDSGAYGLAQIIPSTAKALGISETYKTDIKTNLAGGAQVLKEMYSKFGNWAQAIAGYKGYSDTKSAAATVAANKVLGNGDYVAIPGIILPSDDLANTVNNGFWSKDIPYIHISYGLLITLVLIVILFYVGVNKL